MKKLLVFLCSVTLIFGMVVSASALQFTLNSYDITLSNSDPGLVLYSNPILDTLVSFNLEVGQSVEGVALFTLGTGENSIDLDDIVSQDISVAFSFSSPEVNSSVAGRTGGWFTWTSDYGYVDWRNPGQFYFGDTGLFNISLSNARFNTPGSATIYASLNYVSAASAAPVPEPSTILLMGVGLLGLVGYGRRRLKK